MTYTVELQAPDISRWKTSNTGVDHVWTFDSGRPGRHVMVQALTHGNEICGAIALDWFLSENPQPTPDRGKLTLAFANVAAYAKFDPEHPSDSRYVDEDMNRVWDDAVLLGAGDSSELRRARELRPFVDAADFLLDIHSMHEPCKPLMVCGSTSKAGDKSAALARQLKVPEVLLVDTGHAAGLRMIERGPFGDPKNARTAILIECGQHWEMNSAAVAVDTLLRFLAFTGAAPKAFTEPHIKRLNVPVAKEQQLVRVTEAITAKTENFTFERNFAGLEVLPKAGEVIARDGDEVYRAPYDHTVLVMPSIGRPKVGGTMVRLGRVEPRPA